MRLRKASVGSVSMWRQHQPWLEARGREISRDISLAASSLTLSLGRLLLLLWRAVRPALVLVLNVLAGLILIFEEWGWRPLSALVARLARFPLWAQVERGIAGLPPYAALLVLAVPSVVLIPAKLIGLYMFATGHFFLAGMVIVLAKVASTALIARVFLLTKPALMQIPWFARAYELFIPWQEALFARIRASWPWRYGRALKWRAKHYVRGIWKSWRPRLATAWQSLRPQAEQLWWRLRGGVRGTADRATTLWRQTLSRLQPPDGRL